MAGYIGDLAAKRFPNVARPAIIQLSLVLAAPVRAPLGTSDAAAPVGLVCCLVLGAGHWPFVGRWSFACVCISACTQAVLLPACAANAGSAL